MSAYSLSTRFAHDSKAYASKATHKISELYLATAKAKKGIDVNEAITAAGYIGVSLYTLAFLVNLALGF